MGATEEVKAMGRITRELDKLTAVGRRRVMNYLAETMDGAADGAGPSHEHPRIVETATAKDRARSEKR